MTSHCSFAAEKMEEVAASIERTIGEEGWGAVLSPQLAGVVARIPSNEQVTAGVGVRLALLNDCLVIAERAIVSDGRITETELAYVEPLAREAVRYLARFRITYRDLSIADRQSLSLFLELHRKDTYPFGGRCKVTAWEGLAICNRAIAGGVTQGSSTSIVT